MAVLPFVNASPDPDNEYLSDGITDELIDALSKVEGLHVSSRTSVFALKGKPQDVRAIGAVQILPRGCHHVGVAVHEEIGGRGKIDAVAAVFAGQPHRFAAVN